MRRFRQRGRRGWAYEDLWDHDVWLARIVAGAVPALAEQGHTYPGDVLTEEEWAAVLATIAAEYQHYAHDFTACYDGVRPVGVYAQAHDLFHQRFGALWS